MKILGWELIRAASAPVGLVPVEQKQTAPTSLSPAQGSGWFSWLREGFAGAWQRDIETPVADVLTFGAVFSCITLIASDIAKMGLRIVERGADGVSRPVTSSLAPVLLKPNHFQIRIMFIMQWVISKLSWGNTYVLKERDSRNEVRKLYVLDPARVKPMVAPDGSVFYALTADVLAGIEMGIPAVPASEIIHDVMYPLYHPLVGLSPIHACGLAAMQGLRIQVTSAKFFQNGASLGGVLTAPGAISNETAQRLKEFWQTRYGGTENAGKVAILGDGLKFEPMTATSRDSQLAEQLRMSAEIVCSAFHVPGYKVGVGTQPNQSNIEALDQAYYSQCLQVLIECIEALLDDGLPVKAPRSTEFDLDDLLRMDSATRIDVAAKAVGGGIVAPNEARRKLNLPPLPGGDTVYLQQQYFSLAALDARDRANPAPAPAPSTRPPGGPA